MALPWFIPCSWEHTDVLKGLHPMLMAWMQKVRRRHSTRTGFRWPQPEQRRAGCVVDADNLQIGLIQTTKLQAIRGS